MIMIPKEEDGGEYAWTEGVSWECNPPDMDDLSGFIADLPEEVFFKMLGYDVEGEDD